MKIVSIGLLVLVLALSMPGTDGVTADGPPPMVDATGDAAGVGVSVDDGMLGDSLLKEPLSADTEAASVDASQPIRFALPPGMSLEEGKRLSDELRSPAQVVEWHVDNGQPAFSLNYRSGVDHGIANRFDPSDMADKAGLPPMPLRIHRIVFLVNAEGEPTGPMEWHIWEDNGGHKADVTRDIVPPFVVTGAPGTNVIDMGAVGRSVVIDPPRMFHVGVAKKASDATSPDVLMDDGLPYVGGSGDFHASVTGHAFPADLTTMYCGQDKWILLGFNDADGNARSPAFMIWLEVEWLAPPDDLFFDRVADNHDPAGDFTSGSRIAWGDYDNDGDEDILASGGKLYRNDGDDTFLDVTATANITDTGAGALWADYDNDGDLDFYQYTNNCVPCGRPDNFDDLWRNRGDGTFENVRAVDYGGDPDAPVPRDPLPTEGAAWGDFNNDGYLDLYAGNHVDWDTGACFDDYLWLNNGPPDYSFRDVSEASGVRSSTLCGRGVSPDDFDDDGDLDIFVSNYRLNPDLLWVNQGVGEDGVPRFVDMARAQGVQGVAKMGSFAGAYGHTIGAAWGDLDRDGDQDLVAANLAHSAWLCFSDMTMVYESRGAAGEHKFVDVREGAGVKYVETHSDPSLVDFDNDGYLDLHFTHVYDGWRTSLYRNTTGDALAPRPSTVFLPSLTRGAASSLAGDGRPGASKPHAPQQLLTVPILFDDVTHLSGIYPRTSWGSAWSDYDNDGDVDLAARGLWRNRTVPDADAHFFQVEVVGCGLSNRDAIGAVAVLDTTYAGGWGHLRQEQRVIGARGTGSQDSRVVHFGLGDMRTIESLTVTFPSGQTSVHEGLKADRRERIVEVGAIIRPSAWSAAVGTDITLRADTCGATRVLSWDLDGDGTFDDAEGVEVTWRPAATGMQEAAVKAIEGGAEGITKVTVEVTP